MTIFTKLPDDPGLAAVVVQAEFEDVRKQREVGRVGSFLGDRDHAAINIAAVLACLLLIFMAAVAFFPLGNGIDRGDTLKLLGGFFLGTLGYLFGSLSGSK